MSHSHVRSRHSPKGTHSRVAQFLAASAIVLLAAFLILGRIPSLVNRPRQTAQGLILDSRIERVGTIETSHGGYILYRIETRVQYSLGGDKRDRWIPASGSTSDRASLQMQLLKQPRTCLISWPIHHEESARCELP